MLILSSFLCVYILMTTSFTSIASADAIEVDFGAKLTKNYDKNKIQVKYFSYHADSQRICAKACNAHTGMNWHTQDSSTTLSQAHHVIPDKDQPVALLRHQPSNHPPSPSMLSYFISNEYGTNDSITAWQMGHFSCPPTNTDKKICRYLNNFVTLPTKKKK